MDISRLTPSLTDTPGSEISRNDLSPKKPAASDPSATPGTSATPEDRFTPSATANAEAGSKGYTDVVTLRSTSASQQPEDARAQRLAEIQQRIASGTYQVASGNLADAILGKIRVK